MSRDEFRQLFEQALEAAAQIVEKEYSVAVPRKFQIKFYGLGHSGEVLDTESALDIIYLGEDLFLFLIDLMVIEANPSITTVFLGVGGQPPQQKLEDTWNQPPGTGPFKQIVSLQFKFHPER